MALGPLLVMVRISVLMSPLVRLSVLTVVRVDRTKLR